MGVGASILILSGIVGAAFGGRLFLCTAIEHEPVNGCERAEFGLRCGIGALSVADVRRGVHRDAPRALSSIKLRKVGRWMRRDRPTRAAFRSPLPMYLHRVVRLRPEYRPASG
jgi:hypothetical protein